MEEGLAKRNGRRISKTEWQNGKSEAIKEIAKNLKSIGIPIEQIMEATNLKKEEIEEL